jgi:hypothetical protein
MSPDDLLEDFDPRRYRRAAAIVRVRLIRALPEWRRRRLLIGTRRSAS